MDFFGGFGEAENRAEYPPVVASVVGMLTPYIHYLQHDAAVGCNDYEYVM